MFDPLNASKMSNASLYMQTVSRLLTGILCWYQPGHKGTPRFLLTVAFSPAYEASSLWICPEGERCDPNKVSPMNWHVEVYPVDYCLAEKVPELCSVQFSITIMQWIIAFNALKLVAMLLVLFRYNVEQLVSTVGDAAVSFLAAEDSTTHHMCLASRRNIRDFYVQGQRYSRPYPTQPMRWFLAASRARWIVFSCL
jgi:hypothetical protein